MLRASSTPASASSTTPVADASLTSAIPPTQTQAPTQSQSQSPSSGKPTLKLVHVAGTKYIDYFTDGAKAYSFPGSPDIDSNLTSGMEAFDTPSGDLDAGDHAQEADGSYISNVPAYTYTYTDATSSVPIAAHIATSKQTQPQQPNNYRPLLPAG